MAKLLVPGRPKNLVGKRIRALRTARGLSQEKLAGALQLMGFDCERGTIKRIESGMRRVSDVELKILSNYFQVSYGQLIDGALDSGENDCTSNGDDK